MKVLQNGNSKINSCCLVYSQTPMLTCPNCSGCDKTCYALKAYRQYPNVRASWDGNFRLSLEDPEAFVEQISDAERRSRSTQCRIHSAGDFYSADYVGLWKQICEKNPGTMHWGYSKAFSVPAIAKALDNLNTLPNAHVMPSVYDGQINYGTMEYVKALRARIIRETGKVVKICPCGINDAVSCGKTCRMCEDKNVYMMLFKIH